MSRRLYEITPVAEDDILSIVAWITQQSGCEVSLLIASTIRAKIRQIGKFPGLGHHRPDLTDLDLRFSLVYSYLIVYNANTRPVRIERVIHSARNVSRWLE